MSEETVKKGFKISDFQGKREGKPFAGVTPTKVTILKPGVFINPTEGIRQIREGK